MRRFNGSTAARYVFALGLVLMVGVVRLATMTPNRPVAAPFLLFYPAIAIAAFIGGAGPGLAAVALTVTIVVGFFPHYFPAPANWFWLCLLSPLLVIGFARLKRLRDRSATLAAESLRLRFVVDRVSDCIFLTDDTGIVQYANQTACTQLGRQMNELAGKSIREITAPEDRPAIAALLAGSDDRPAVPKEIAFLGADGGTIPLEINCTVIKAQNARLMHVAARDTTERKAIDQKLAEARRWEGLGVLAGGIAHEFNNLLTSIMGNASLARDGMPANHPIAGLLHNIETASERSAELVRMMLATSGYKPRHREAFRVDRVLRKVLGERQTPGKAVVRVDAETAEFESDLRLIETLLWALISNAAESYGEKEGEVWVWVRSFANGDAPHEPRGECSFEEGEMPRKPCLGIVVKDNGCGMTPELIGRAFDPFFTTKFMGRGLGLPAVRGIVRAHQGRLWVRTHPGEGTRVEVWLPSAGYDESA